MTTLLAIDPGPEESAFVVMDNAGVLCRFGKRPNLELLVPFGQWAIACPGSTMVLEMIASYGMPVGAPVFTTCVWIGRFVQAWTSHGCPHALITRQEVKLELCGNRAAKGANIRQALIDRYGPDKSKAIGVKKTPGPLYGVKDDVWSALAVATAYSAITARSKAA